MAFTRDNIRKRVSAILQDDASIITSTEIDEQIDAALDQVNRDKARTKVVDITGDGTQDYKLPTDFQRGFSMIQPGGVEFPAGENPPIFLEEDDDWIEYEDPSKAADDQLRLRFIRKTPTSVDDIRLTYSIRHVLTNDSTTSTVVDQDVFNAIVYQALVLALRAKASKFNESADASIDADTVNLQTAASNYLFLAERHERTYKLFVGKSEDVKAAQAFAEKDVKFAHGEDFLFHSSSQR